MALLGMLLLTYTAIVCQTSLGDVFALGGVSPDFLALLVIVAIFSFRGTPAVIWAAAAGLAADCVGSHHLGVQMLIAVALTYSIQTCIAPAAIRLWFVKAPLAFLVIVLLTGGSSIAQLLLSRQEGVFSGLFPAVLATALYSLLIGLPLNVAWRLVRRVIPSGQANSISKHSNRWGLLNG